MSELRKPERLDGVHPLLGAVVRRGAEIFNARQAARGRPVGVLVVEGARSAETCKGNWGKGRTAAECRAVGIPISYAQPKLRKVTWSRTPFSGKHYAANYADGKARAVDLLPAPYDWEIDDPKSTPEIDDAFAELNRAMMQAADELKVKIRWGANWDGDRQIRERGESDNPHWEMI
jgi:peptidoglycan L-alanyl-D-glutamate endopeptidase CwlK